jgi:hypothetical protein
MKAKEFCQKYNLGVDSAWIMRKYAKLDLSLVDWYNLVQTDLTQIPIHLSQAFEAEKNTSAVQESGDTSKKTNRNENRQAK